MKKIILFDYYREAEVCEERLRILRFLNPDIPIFGIYGAERRDYHFYSFLEQYFEHVFIFGERDSHWRCQNGDLIYRRWFQEVGKDVEFDLLYRMHWDTICFDSLDTICGIRCRSHLSSANVYSDG